MSSEIKNKVMLFMSEEHTQDEIDEFYVTQILQHDKRSINEILNEE